MKIDGINLVENSVFLNLTLSGNTSDPLLPNSGEISFNTTSDTFRVYGTDGVNWQDLITAKVLGNHTTDNTLHFTESNIDHTNILNIGTNSHVQIDTHIAGNALNHFAANIVNTPAGNIIATTVQAAINELDNEKSDSAHTHTFNALSDVVITTSLNNDFIIQSSGDFINVNPSTARTAMGVVIGTDVQAFDAGLAALAALDASDNGILVQTAVDTFEGRTIIESTTTAIDITNGDGVSGNPSIGIEEGLDSIAGLTMAADEMLFATGDNAFSTTALTADARGLLDDATVADMRATLELTAGNTGDIWVKRAGDTMTGPLNMDSQKITNLPSPTDPGDAVNKQYADSIAAGLDPKDSCHTSTTADLGFTYAAAGGANDGVGDTLTDGVGVTTIDGVILTAIDQRVLVKDQTTSLQNGIYAVTTLGTGSVATVLTRALDFDGSPANEVSEGAFTFVVAGNTNNNSGWVVNGTAAIAGGDIVVGNDNILFTKVSGAGAIQAGTGLVQVGNAFNVNMGAGITVLPTDEVGVDLFATNALILTTDGTTPDSTAAARLHLLLDGTTLSQSSTGLKVATAGITETELNTSVAGDGLIGGAGNALAVVTDTGSAGTIGTIVVSANAVGVALGTTGITAAPGDHNHNATYVNITGDTMTGNLTISNTNPILYLNDTDSAIDNRLVKLRSTAQTFTASFANDADNAAINFLLVARTGNVADTITLTADTIKHIGIVTGDTAPTAADHLTRKDYVDTFLPLAGGTLSGNLTISNTNPILYLNDTDSAIDNRLVKLRSTAQTFTASFANDADTAAINFLSVARTGNTADAITLTATTVVHTGVVTGNTAPTAANHLTRKDYVDGELANYLPLGGGTLIGDLVLSKVNPTIDFNETDAALDEKNWRISPFNGKFRITPFNDSMIPGADAFTISRTGTTADTIDLVATTIVNTGIVTGNTAPTAVDHLTRKDYVDLRVRKFEQPNTRTNVITRERSDASATSTLDYSGNGSFIFGGASGDVFSIGQSAVTSNGDITISNSNPSFHLTDTDSTVDNRNYRFSANSDVLVFELTNDAVTTNTAFFRVDRTGNVADTITLTAATIKHTGIVTGDTAPTAANHLTRKDYVDGLQNVPPRVVTSSTTLVLGDSSNAVEYNSSSAGNITIPPNSSVNFDLGAQMIIRGIGTGVVSIVAGSGVTLQAEGGLVTTAAQYGAMTIYQSSLDVWAVIGGKA